MDVGTPGVQRESHTKTRSLSIKFLVPGRGNASGLPDVLAAGRFSESFNAISVVRGGVPVPTHVSDRRDPFGLNTASPVLCVMVRDLPSGVVVLKSPPRSEERRVGKECECCGSAVQ